MLGYMNKESFRKTLESYKVTLADQEKIMDERRDTGNYLNYYS